MKSSLTQNVLGGFFWMSFGKIGHIILHLIILAIMARLLTPNDFGMLAASMVVINFSDIFVQIGVGPSIIIKKEIDNNYIRNAFSISILFGIGIGLTIFFSAPIIARLFKIEELTIILSVLCFIFPIRSFSIVAESLLKKSLRFKILAFRSLISYAVGYGLIGITLALLDFGIWALVAATLSQALINSIFVLIAYPHSKKLYFRKNIAKELLFYGGGFTLSRFFSYTANQADNFIVARWLGASALGFYNKAYTLMKTPVNLYGQMLHDVLFPALSNVDDKSSQMTSVFSMGTLILSLFSMPLMLFMLVLAPEIIMVLLGEQWTAAIEPFQIIVASMYFRVGYRISVTIAKSSGIIYKNAYLQIVYTVLIIVASFIGKKWGINGVSTGVTIAIFIQFILMANLGLSITTITWKAFLRLHFPGIGYSIILAPLILGGTYFTRKFGLSEVSILIVNLLLVISATFIIIRLKLHKLLGKDFLTLLDKFIGIINKKRLSISNNIK